MRARADRSGFERARLRGRRRAAPPTGRGEGVARRSPTTGSSAAFASSTGGGVVAPPQHHGGVRLGRRRSPFHGARAAAGRQLAQPARCGCAVPPSQATHVGRQVTALEYARSLVHRDIKPANLLFDEHGIVRVADFGLARTRRRQLDRAGRCGRRHRAVRRAGTGHWSPTRRARRPLLARDRVGGGRHGHGARRRRHRDRHARAPHAHRDRRAARAGASRPGRRACGPTEPRRAVSRCFDDG